MKNRKIPLRKCLGCHEQKPKKELMRVVKSKDGEISVDFHGKAHGRGAYICPDIKCFEKAVKKKAISRALGKEIGNDILDALRQEIENEGKNS